MMRTVQHWLVQLVISILVLCLLVGGSSLPAAARSHQNASVATLVALRAASHPEATPKYDRVVFEFRGMLPESIRYEYVSPLIADGSGLVLPVKGKAILRVVFSPASAHTEAGEPTVPARARYAFPIVREVVRSGDFEAVVSYGIGLSRQTQLRFFTLTNPTRAVFDFLWG